MATVPAVVGSARLGNFRLGYQNTVLAARRVTRVNVFVDGVLANSRVRLSSLSIRDVVNDAPNTCSLVLDGTPAPESGMALRILINSNTPRLLFSGTIQTDDVTYEGKPAQLCYPCSGIDDTASLNNRRPFGIYTNISATTVAQDLIARFAPGFTSANVQAALPSITVAFDGSEGFSGCLRQIVKLIGGYFYVEDRDLHLFLTEASETPDTIDTSHRFLNDPPITASSDDSQLRTRVYGRGHSETTLIDLAASATIIPVADVALYSASGGQLIVSTTPDGSPTEILTYTGIQSASGGALVGPGVQPSVQPALALVGGAGLGSGLYQYAYTFVTASGESLPSPSNSVTTGGTFAAPLAAISFGGFTNAGATVYPFTAGDAIRYWAYTFTTASGETTASPIWAPATAYPLGAGGPYTCRFDVPLGPSGTTGRKIYRTVAAGSQLKFVGTIANNITISFQDEVTDGTLGANVPTSNTAGSMNQVAVTGVAIGPSGVTSRKVYRTAAAGSQLKLLSTIADNTTTTIGTDSAADGTLGANVPISDTSGLVQSFGQVNPGVGSIPVTSTAPFSSTGGFVQTESGEIIFYLTTITSTNRLSGLSSFTTAIPYGSTIVPLPALTGVTGLTKAVQRGSVVHLWVQRDDTIAQLAAADRESTATYTSDGIHEHLLIDERRGIASLSALCDAELALFARPLVTVVYATRDVKTKSGKPIVVNLASPPISETLTIQDVTITEINVAPAVAPRFTVTASSLRFSLEDVLRRMSALLPE